MCLVTFVVNFEEYSQNVQCQQPVSVDRNMCCLSPSSSSKQIVLLQKTVTNLLLFNYFFGVNCPPPPPPSKKWLNVLLIFSMVS